MLLIFLGLYLYLSKRACLNARSYIRAVVVYFTACGVAQSFNLLFAGKVNCFYISPFVQSPLAVFSDIYASCGWVINMVLMFIGMTLASAVVYYVGYLFRLRSAKKEKLTV